MYSQSGNEESAPRFPCHLGEASPRPFLPRPRSGAAHAPPPGCLRRGLWAASRRAAATPGSSPRLPAAPRSPAADAPRAQSRERTRGPSRQPEPERQAARRGGGAAHCLPVARTRGRRSAAPPARLAPRASWHPRRLPLSDRCALRAGQPGWAILSLAVATAATATSA